MDRNVYLVRIICVFSLIACTFLALINHLYELQIRRHKALYDQARQKYLTTKTWTGNRGCIYDRDGNPLIGNLACRDILADLVQMPGDDASRSRIINILVERLDVDPAVLRRRFYSGAREVVVKRQVAIDTAERIENLALPGIRFVDNQKRYYPKGELAVHILGFTDSENNGVCGIEYVWNDQLCPRKVTRLYERNRKGQVIPRESPKIGQAVDGNDVYLTIIEPVQHIVEAELSQIVEQFRPRHAYAIMANPKTGAIMALAQRPAFDPNNRRDLDPDHWESHYLSDVYDPGSTMKCIAIAGAIDFGIVTLDTVFDCENGFWYYRGRPLRDSGHKYGELTVAEIVQKSSNIGTAKLALLMGANRLYQTLRRFGFGEKTGIGLPYESPGILRSIPNWDGLSITRIPIGQGISVTPLQMLQAYSGLANDGRIMRLRLVERVVDHRTGQTQRLAPQFQHYAIRGEAVRKIVTAMKSVTREGGTATNAAVEGYEVAGKTGTSQKLINGSYSGHGKYVASFIGFVPADDPAFVLIVVADEPSTGQYYGGTVAAPAFSRIADQTLRYLGIPQNPIVSSD